MALFQESVLKNYLKQQDKNQVEKAYKKYTKYFHNPAIQQNIKESKEEQFQEGFLRELFVNVLDYVLNPSPDFNLTTEFKNQKGAKKADGAILKEGNALAVIELKGTKTKDLESIRQQAFDYKANQKGCVYVVTSNFEKLRFYINNAVDFEEFNLFTLNQEQFSLLYLCLHKENLLNNLPLKINNDSLVAEEKITKKFYSDYSLFKRELYRDLVKKNMKNEVFREELNKEDNERAVKNIKLALFKKSQKLIDRFLFIFFAEDRGLLPANSTLKILEQWEKLKELDEIVPLYNRYIKYFNYLDTGRKGTEKQTEIFAYNGGLFNPDPVLDSLLIDDGLLYKHTQQLANYDFESQIDVNILGHIFENSLNEIESINAEIEGTEFDKQKTKRKKDGVFYTPKYITKYIVDNTVGKLCTDKKAELGIVEEEYMKSRKGRPMKTLKALQEKLEEYRQWMLALTILDPACGSGAFLNQALDFLIKEHRYIDELQASLLGGSIVFQNIENTILENNIYGVDLNEESVEIAKLSLWLRTAQPRRKLNDLSNNIKCGNSLIDDPKIAGDKAFDWEKEFPHVFNPQAKKETKKEIPQSEPDYVKLVKEKSKEAQHKAEQAAKLSREALEISKQVYEYAEKISTVNEPKAIYGKKKGGFDVVIGNPPYGAAFTEKEKAFIQSKFESYQYKFESYIYFYEKGIDLLKHDGFLSFITPELFLRLEKSVNIRKLLLANTELIELKFCGEDVFSDVKVNSVILTTTKRKVQNNSFAIVPEKDQEWKYEFSSWSSNSLLTIDYEISPIIRVIIEKIEQNSNRLGELGDAIQGLTPYDSYRGHSKELIKNRGFHFTNKVDDNCGKWLDGKHVTRYLIEEGEEWLRYGDWLAAPREKRFFEGSRLLFREVPGQNKRIQSTYVEKTYYHGHSITPFKLNSDKSNEDLFFILAVVNSKILSWFVKYKSSNFSKNTFPKLNPKDIKLLPIPIGDAKPLILIVKKHLRDNIEFKNLNSKFINYLDSQFNHDSLSKKLQNWHELEFSGFITELNKAIKKSGGQKLTKMDEMEWMEVFEAKKAEVQALKTEVDKTDKQIDQMVYELYGLTDEEIRIVEESAK